MLFRIVSLVTCATAAFAGKRGLCWPWYNGFLDPGLFNDEVVAIYDYETFLPPARNSNRGLSFIGMQRCLDCSSSPVADLRSRWQQQGWDTVFTLNEPDVNGITPDQAASWYIQYINPLPIMKALPAVTSSVESGEGLSWLSEMIAACAGQCDFHYINLHWYGGSFEQFQAYVESANAKFPNNPIVLTEFALQSPPGGQADQITFFKKAFLFLDSASFVALYFPFLATSPSLFEENDSRGAAGIGTGSCLYNDDGTISAVGNLMF